MRREALLAVAERIGRRLAADAIWSGASCTWTVHVADRTDLNRSVAQAASGPIYQGSAGIAFFLAELARATSDAELARTAEGGLRHAVDAGNGMAANAFGFHTGRVGIAWAAARLAHLLDRGEFLDRARQLLEPLAGNASHDQGLDVISGAAGAIPALLELGRLLDREEPIAAARRLGDHLICRAHREPDGWSWAMMSNTVARHLCGLAHGAAGAGLALLELARASGDGRFRFAAEMAFLYERHFFDPQLSNWPDLRNNELGNLLHDEGRRDELVERAHTGTLPANRRHTMTAWCHGSPGIGLSRLRAYELTGQDLYRREARAAIASTLESIAADHLEHDSFSLCHGIAGNCALPLAAAELFGEPAWRRPAVEAAAYGWERYEKAGRPWPCGTVNSASDPSLLLGEAGIGLFYLRLAEPQIPSPLLLRPVHGDPVPDAADGFTALAREAADDFFGVSRRAVERLTGSSVWTPPSAGEEPLVESPPAALCSVLERRVEKAGGELRELLDDAFRADRERFAAMRGIGDFTTEFVRGLTRRPWEKLETRHTVFERAPESRLLELKRDWRRWIEEDPGSATPPPEAEVRLLLYRQRDHIHEQRVGVFAALLLELLEEPLALTALADRVAGALDGPIDRSALSRKILPQLEALYRAGFVVEARPEAAGSRPPRPVASAAMVEENG